MEENIQEFTITKENRGAIGFTNNTEELVIPEFFVGTGFDGTIKGKTYQITSIGAYAFFHATKLRKVILPDCITVIEHKAFSNCTLLEDVIFPESLIKIAAGAFYNCNLQKIKLPENLRFIRDKAFLGNAIKTLTLPNNLETIGDKAFASCGFLESVDTSKAEKLKEIHKEAFSNCPQLKAFEIPKNVTYLAEDAFWDNSLCRMDSKSPAYKSIQDGQLLIDTEQSSVVWASTQSKNLVLPPEINKINFCMFPWITYVFVPKTVQKIAQYSVELSDGAAIIIDKPKDSIPNAPWGAKNAHIYWIG